MFDVVRRVPCTDSLAYEVVSFGGDADDADSEKDCPGRSSPFTVNGYDRIVCLDSQAY
jgi:hypothetical protein